MRFGLLGLALLLALTNVATAGQKKKKNQEESSLADQKIRILRMNPAAFTTEPNVTFYLELRVEPLEENRHLVIVLESGSMRKVSSKSLDGLNERAVQVPMSTFLVAGNYQVIIATCDGRSKGDDPADLGKVINKVERKIVVGGSPSSPVEDERADPGFSLPTTSQTQNVPEDATKITAEDFGNPCYLRE